MLLTTHYLDEAQQLADRVAVLRAGEIVRMGPPSELTAATTTVADPLPLGRRGGRASQTDEPTRALHELTAAAVAEGRRARGARGAARDARGRLPRARSRRSAVSALLAPAEGRAAHLLAQPRVGDLHLHLPADALPAARVGLRRRTPSTARFRSPSVLVAGLIGYARREHRLRGPRDRARGPARVRDPEAAALDAASRARSTSATMLVSNMLVFALQTITVFALGVVPLRRRRAGAARLASCSSSRSARSRSPGSGSRRRR